MDFVCPGDPAVWDVDGRRFGPCFADLVLGFAGNAIAAVAALGLFLAKRNTNRAQNVTRSLSEKLLAFGVPGFAACLSLLGLTMLAKKKFEGKDVKNYELFFTCSQFIAWMSLSLVRVSGAWFEILYNPIMCFFWILKVILEIPHLQYKLILLKAASSFIEIISFCTATIFGLFVTVAAVIGQSGIKREANSIEAPLIPNNEKAEGETTDMIKDYSLWELLTFKFVNPVMDIGITRQLDFTDLLELPNELRATSCYDKLLSSWTAEYQNHHDNSSLLRAMSNSYGWTYLRLGLLKVLNDSIGFVSPLLLNKFIRLLQQGSDGMDGYILAISLGLTSIIKSFLDSQYSFRLAKLKLMLRSSIMGIIYWKCLCLSLAERSRFSEGEIQTFMSVDADRTINLCNSLHDAWSLPLQIGVALYLLYTQVNYAFLSGLAITIILIPVNKWISTRIAGATEKMMKQKDRRISCAGELLAHIRTVKMYSWEKLFTERLVERRESEVKHLATRKYLDAWCVYFWATTPTLFSLSTFSIFAITGHALDAATVFTCVALFNTLISPLNSFPWVINGMIDAVISSRRLSNYLSTPEHHSSELNASADLLNHHFKRYTKVTHNPMAIVFQNVSCSWSSSSVAELNIVLRDISLQLQKGFFIAIVGEVGSGKSSLLNTVIGETRVISGSISSCGSIAYVPQVPWILSGSLRDNILLGKEFDPRRGDMSHIGEKGTNLSGGQRARLALARALYHNSDVYLFDDILSAVDSQVASCILEKAIMGHQLMQKTRLLSTHNLQAIFAADMIVVMANGLIKWFGTPKSFLATPYSRTSKPDNSSPTSFAASVKDKTPMVTCELKPDAVLEDSVVCYEETKDRVEEEARKQGKVELGVYKKYAAFVGWSTVVLIFLSAFLMQTSRNGNDIWLTYWVDTSTGTNNTRFYLIILAMFGIINSLFTLGRAFSFAFGGLRAAIHIHASLLENIISAPICFFDQNPSGRILNRLSSDLYAVDDSLPFILNIFVANFFSLFGTLVVLSYSQVSFLLVLLPLWLIYRKLQFYYRSTSREVRRLDSVARSPIYSSFTETLDGSSTIRAFQNEGFFFERFIQHVTLYQKTSYTELVASLWLSLRLQLLAGFIILFIAMMATISFHSSSLVNFATPGLVGLALSYAAPVVSLLNGFLTTFTETEKEMISVERVDEYIGIPQEELQGSEPPPRSWPTEGKIEFEHVTLKYKPELPPALSDVSFLIASGMQVGIIGRTGAGKSSILNALFRLVPIWNGRILVDGIDLAKVAVRELRGHFAVVPQSPFLFDGSLRENLDPFNTKTDLRIWEVLENCHMKGQVESIGGLDIHVKESGASFSVGQRQLLCLARAILKSSKVLCLDECTANVDNQTASLLQNTISAECKGMTVLTIAHRISTVMKMDNILVLDQGKLVEEGNPEALMNHRHSRFAQHVKASQM
ncbi:ABC transporter C family member 13 isoform X2 [Zea mays]|uniref:ABC transporter C family member 13 isoform X2 n=1 Tax=Zea mays TaxID=4577 RepID=UPI0004DECAAB|nr:ABC transporter C family member 13 isoform X2 [Zea mays]|eukprot:XP_008659190.1 ABC transporter C family member 13 isoform X2 [Zea mays]